MSEDAGIGGDVNAIVSNSANAGQLAEAMLGLKDDFEDAMNAAKNAAAETECAEGYTKFLDKYRGNIVEVEEHGLRLAGNSGVGGSELKRNDQESEEGYSGANKGLSRPINH
ncbi:hypothetical protein GCM10009799_51010 [Nocardiopsis rhodophaea]|uniref:Uncharacterized protein n=1 Tax=Nocardiopsis rhodophaea TaxID=280238 RepID=A0ABP5F4K2_9ACTN